MTVRGKFITIEGTEGAGKSTQAEFLRAALEAHGVSLIRTREPGGTPFAESVRKLVLSGGFANSHFTELCLMSAARQDHVLSLIEPSLAAGTWVMSDRYADSTMAYQGYARGGDREQIRKFSELATNGLKPDLTLIFDIDPRIGFERVHKRGEALDHFEAEKIDFFDKVRAGYQDIAKDEPQRVVLIDASQSIEDVRAAVWKVVAERFSL